MFYRNIPADSKRLRTKKKVIINNQMSPSLADLRPGQTAKIVAIDCDGAISRRLMEMGLLPGTEVRLIRSAPLGDPIELHVRGYALSVRRAEAARIAIRTGGI